MKNFQYLIVALVTICLVGCTAQTQIQSHNSANNIDEPVAHDYNMTTIAKSISLGGFIEFPSGMTQDDFVKQSAEIQNSPEAQIVNKFLEQMKSKPKWQDAHRLAKECAEKIQGKQFTWYFHQTLAATMLGQYLAVLPPKLDVRQAIDYYVDLLLYYKNDNESIVLSRVLPMMDGYWSNEKLLSVSMMYYNSFNTQTTPAQFVSRSIAGKAEKVAKLSPEQYSSTESVANLSKEIREKIWNERIVSVSKRNQVEPYPIDRDMNELQKSMRDSRLVIAMLADYWSKTPNTQK